MKKKIPWEIGDSTEQSRRKAREDLVWSQAAVAIGVEGCKGRVDRIFLRCIPRPAACRVQG